MGTTELNPTSIDLVKVDLAIVEHLIQAFPGRVTATATHEELLRRQGARQVIDYLLRLASQGGPPLAIKETIARVPTQ